MITSYKQSPNMFDFGKKINKLSLIYQRPFTTFSPIGCLTRLTSMFTGVPVLASCDYHFNFKTPYG